jgi:cell division protein FtsN
MASGNTKNFEFRLKKAGLIIVIAGMAALLCFAFLLGVNVGENLDTYPEKISSLPQKALALIWHKGKIQPAENLTDDKSSPQQSKEEDIDLTFYKTLTGKKGVAKEKSAADKKQVVETVPPATAPPQKNNEEAVNSNTVTETPKQTPEAMAEKKKEEKPIVKEKTPSSAPGKHKYIIQAASLKEKAKAYQLNKKIAELGFDAKIIPIDIKGKGTWYRVIISDFENKAKAQEAAAKISKKTGTSCIIRSTDTVN